MSAQKRTPTYRDMVYSLVRQVPPGKVVSYGQVARMLPHCTARMVGFALATPPTGEDIPWQRVINAQGKISPHGAGFGSAMQRSLLEAEGVQFDHEGCIDFQRFGWQPD